jgi:hypothetical protein
MKSITKSTLLASMLVLAGVGIAPAQTVSASPDATPLSPDAVNPEPIGPGGGSILSPIPAAPGAVFGAPFGPGPMYAGRSVWRPDPGAFYNENDETGNPTGRKQNPASISQ